MIRTPMPGKQFLRHLEPGKVAYQLANHANRMVTEPIFGQVVHEQVSFTPNLITLYSRGLEILTPEIISVSQVALSTNPQTIWLIPDFLDLVHLLQDSNYVKRETDRAFQETREVWLESGFYAKQAAELVVPQRINITLEPEPFYSRRHWHAYWTFGYEIKMVLAVIMQRHQDKELRFYSFRELIRLAFSNLFANHSKSLVLDPMFEVYDWREIASRFRKVKDGNNNSGEYGLRDGVKYDVIYADP